MKAEEIKRVLIAGAGTMGRSIGLSCAVRGCEVVLYDVKEDILDAARRAMAVKIDKMVAAGALTPEAAESVKANITTTTDLAVAGADADLVSESIPEDPDIKGEFFEKLHYRRMWTGPGPRSRPCPWGRLP